jgi:hypothetical protein
VPVFEGVVVCEVVPEVVPDLEGVVVCEGVKEDDVLGVGVAERVVVAEADGAEE